MLIKTFFVYPQPYHMKGLLPPVLAPVFLTHVDADKGAEDVGAEYSEYGLDSRLIEG